MSAVCKSMTLLSILKVIDKTKEYKISDAEAVNQIQEIIIKMTIKEIKKDNSLSDADIAQAFGYKSAMAYSNSSAKKRIEKGIEYIYNLNEKQ